MSAHEEVFPASRFIVAVVAAIGVAAILGAPAIATSADEAGLALGALFVLSGAYLIAKAIQLAGAKVVIGASGLRYRRRLVAYEDVRSIRKGWIGSRNIDLSRSLLGNSWRYEINVDGQEPIVIWGKLYPNDERFMEILANRAAVSVTEE